jgi:O-6-methylguanine DNA methyltransferase
MRSRERETLFCSVTDSPFGPLTLALSELGVVAVHFGRVVLSPANFVESAETTSVCRRELDEYFAGKRTQFTVPLDLRGTAFQKQCWQALLDIPYGETRSYADIARVIGRPRAFRAVGMANHDNPVAIIVPCHRVVGSNGNLTGYGGGLDVKRQLLELERRHRIIG